MLYWRHGLTVDLMLIAEMCGKGGSGSEGIRRGSTTTMTTSVDLLAHGRCGDVEPCHCW